MKNNFLTLLAGVTLGCCANPFVGMPRASAQTQSQVPNMIDAAGANRPSNVPDGYMMTPFGYFHPSCIYTLAPGEHQLQDGRIAHADGTVTAAALSCGYPSYTQAGTTMNPAGQGPSALLAPSAPTNVSNSDDPSFQHQWVEDGAVGTGSATISFSALNARWTVPAQPNEPSNQTLYFFPGFEDLAALQTILQPVLGWHAGNWTIASFNCCKAGTVVESTPVSVTSGDRIYGSITSSCPAGTSSCATWNVLSVDLTTGKSTTLENSPSDGQVFDNAQGGVLEAYNISACANYPADRHISFDDIQLFGQDGHLIAAPAWRDDYIPTIYPAKPNITPQCNYGVTLTDKKITLAY